METTEQRIGAYIIQADGKQVLSAESRAESLAIYYSHRMAYDPQDRRKVIGTYSPTGEVIPFNLFPNKSV